MRLTSIALGFLVADLVRGVVKPWTGIRPIGEVIAESDTITVEVGTMRRRHTDATTETIRPNRSIVVRKGRGRAKGIDHVRMSGVTTTVVGRIRAATTTGIVMEVEATIVQTRAGTAIGTVIVTGATTESGTKMTGRAIEVRVLAMSVHLAV
jgi:hypothetical protein